jgi:hypothetical protein
MARTMGLSQTYISILANGARPVTDEIERILLLIRKNQCARIN